MGTETGEISTKPMMAAVVLLMMGSIVSSLLMAGKEEGVDYFTCPYCGGVFASYDELRAHITAEHPWEGMPEPPPGWEEPEGPEFEPGAGPCPPSPVVVDNWCMRTENGHTVYYEGNIVDHIMVHGELYRTTTEAIGVRWIDESQTHPDYIALFLKLWPEEAPMPRPGLPPGYMWRCPYCTSMFSSYAILRVHVMGTHYPKIIYTLYYVAPSDPDNSEYRSVIFKIAHVDAKYYEGLEAGTLTPCIGYYKCRYCDLPFNTYREFADHMASQHPD